MKIAFILLLHKNPGQAARLMDRINSPDSYFFVHVDRHAPLRPFQAEITPERYHHLYWTKREKVFWGQFSIAQAALNGLEAVLASGVQPEYVVLLSGQDYPLKNIESIFEFYQEQCGKTFTYYHSIKDHPKKKRYQYYLVPNIQKRILLPIPNPKNKPLVTVFNALIQPIIKYPRSFPTRVHPYGGATWWSMHMEDVRYVWSYIKQYPEYVRFCRTCSNAAELFFQTILVGSRTEAQRKHLVNDCLNYQDWEHSVNTRNPAIITKEHFPNLLKSDKLYARKFDLHVDADILDLIDKQMLKR